MTSCRQSVNPQHPEPVNRTQLLLLALVILVVPATVDASLDGQTGVLSVVGVVAAIALAAFAFVRR